MTTAEKQVTVDAPDHVSPDLVRDFNFFEDLQPGDVYLNLSRLHQGSDIFYSRCLGGHWVFTRYDDVDHVLSSDTDFASGELVIPRIDKPFQLLPVEANAPIHREYRAILQPFFTPARMARLNDTAREMTRSLVENFFGTGECEFVSEFAVKMPTAIFMSLVDLPPSDAGILVPLVGEYFGGDTLQTKEHALCELIAYVDDKLAERRRSSGNDMLSAILAGRVENGRLLTANEASGMGALLLIGGSGTVITALSMIASFLAQNDAHRRELAAHPDRINEAIEELMRRYGPGMSVREVAHDLEYKGIFMKKGDMVLLPMGLTGLDERRFPHAFTVDFARRDKRHQTFGRGPHSCIGAALARIELRVFLSEWMQRIPEFQIKQGTTPVMASGQTHSLLSLELQWRL